MALHCKKNLCKLNVFKCCWGLYPNDSAVKNPPTSAGDSGSVPGSGRSPEGENGSPFQYSGLGNPMYRGAWRAIMCGITKESDTPEDAHTEAG